MIALPQTVPVLIHDAGLSPRFSSAPPPRTLRLQAGAPRRPGGESFIIVTMNRRAFLSSLAAAVPLASAQEGPPADEPILKLTPRGAPAIGLNHLGFVPDAKKILVVRAAPGMPDHFTLEDIGGPPQPFRLAIALKKAASDLGDCLTGNFSHVDRQGMYQVTVGEERSVPFFIRSDVWRRTLPKAVSYIHAQRCGVEVPNVHPACHLDDARRRDTGEHVDVTGGWHDAGDLRKWMSATMLNGFALLDVLRTLGDRWDAAGAGAAPLLDEFRWGNSYFLRMQDADGLVWADTAGGVNGDNSDNHWTDNQVGTGDDRYINPAKSGTIQGMFVALQAMAAQAFRKVDSDYSARCLNAALRCWEAARRGDSAEDAAWWARAAAELYGATGRPVWENHAAAHARQLLSLQVTQFGDSQKLIRGFWRTSPQNPAPYCDAVHSCLPSLVLLELAGAFPDHADAPRWRDAVRLQIDGCAAPLASRSAWAIVPFGVFRGSPTKETYRPLAGALTYRYFMPVRKEFWWVGTTSHLEGYALLLARAARAFSSREYRDLAFRQLEWVMGANPFGACLMTGEGMRNPYPHSRFVGLIPGGILNGIGGNAADEPVLDTEYGFDWRTTEYWTPHNYHYIATLIAL